MHFKISHTYQIIERLCYRLYWSIHQINSQFYNYKRNSKSPINCLMQTENCSFMGGKTSRRWRKIEENNGGGQDCLFTVCKEKKPLQNVAWWGQKCSHNRRQTSARTHVHTASHTNTQPLDRRRTDRGWRSWWKVMFNLWSSLCSVCLCVRVCMQAC